MSAMAGLARQSNLPAARKAGFGQLLGWELHHVGRSPLLWIVLLVLLAAMAWGARSGSALHRAQDAAIERSRSSDERWSQEIAERARRYAAVASERVPYWQDPTDIAGFSRYFLRAHSYKPNLPQSPLAVGGSDLLPTQLPVTLETPFGVAPNYDFENPRALAMGRFDLGFVLVYLLPMALIILLGLMGTFERDHGMLRLIAAQRAGPRAWLGARVVAIFAWLAPPVLIGIIAALQLAGADLGGAMPELLAALAAVAAYLAFWTALGFLVLSAWPRAAGAVSVMGAAWILLAVGLPLLGSAAAARLGQAPSAIAYIDAQRQANDAIAAERDALLARAFRSRPDLAGALGRIGELDYATRLTFLAPELERRLQPLRDRQAKARHARERFSHWAGYAAPPLGLAQALSRLAGTDPARHQHFEQQTVAFQRELRGWFYPRVQRQIATPTPRSDSYGRLNFNEFGAIPAYAWRELPARARVAAALPFTGWLLVLATLLAGVAAARLRQWPAELSA